MSLISRTIPNFVNGVSQQPPSLRLESQGELQENGLSSVIKGLEKRPGFHHIKDIGTITGMDDAFVHVMRRDENEAYLLVIKDNSLRVFDLTGFGTGTIGTEVNVYNGNGTANTDLLSAGNVDYLNFNSGVLAGLTFASTDIAATTIADFTYIANKQYPIKINSSTTNLTRPYEALIYVKGADYGMKFAVNVYYHDSSTTSTDYNRIFRASYELPDGTVRQASGKNSAQDSPTVTAQLNNQATTHAINVAQSLYDVSPLIEGVPEVNTTNDPAVAGFSPSNAEVVSNGTVKNQIINFDTNTQIGTDGTTGLRALHGVSNFVVRYETQDKLNTGTAAVGRGISNLTISSGGTGYSNISSKTLTATGGGGSGFAGSYTVSGGVIDSVTITNEGSGYTSTPTIVINGTGTGASITPTVSSIGDKKGTTSVIHIYNPEQPFSIEVDDGQGGAFISAVVSHEGSKSFASLPPSIPQAYNKVTQTHSGSTILPTYTGEYVTAKIQGEKNNNQDDYYVNYDENIWKEIPRPKFKNDDANSRRNKLDDTTMPHELVRNFYTSGTYYGKNASTHDLVYFSFNPASFTERKAGDDDTNPFPSFAQYDASVYTEGAYTIRDVFFHRNRLGFISDENVIFSQAGDYNNFFKSTVIADSDSNPIDVAVSNNQVSILQHAIPFQEQLILFSDLQQFTVGARETLTPKSVTIDVSTQFETSTDAKPVPAGKYIFFPFKRGEFSGLREYFVVENSEQNDAVEVTAHVPQYIPGKIRQMASSSNEEMIVALSSTERKNIYVYRYYWQDRQKVQSAWSVWKSDGNIVATTFLGSELYALINRSDEISLERIDLSTDPASLVMRNAQPVLLDRRILLKHGSGAGSTVDADSLLPLYGSIADAFPNDPPTANDIVYVAETGEVLGTGVSSTLLSQILQNGTARWQAIKGGPNSTMRVFAGIPYTFKYEVSEQVMKVNDSPANTARLQLRNINLNFNKTGFFKVKVSPKPIQSSSTDTKGRAPRTKVFSGSTVGVTTIGEQALQEGTFKVPVLARSSQVKIELENDTHLPCVFQSAEWEGYMILRSNRV